MALPFASPPLGVQFSILPPAPSKLATFAYPVSASLGSSKDSESSGKSGRRVWRRRKLTKRDERSHFGERALFVEEQVHKIRDTVKHISGDIDSLLLNENSKYAFAMDVAKEALTYVENDPDRYTSKKPILHVLSDRINETGFHRPEAYYQDDPFKPRPGVIRNHGS